MPQQESRNPITTQQALGAPIAASVSLFGVFAILKYTDISVGLAYQVCIRQKGVRPAICLGLPVPPLSCQPWRVCVLWYLKHSTARDLSRCPSFGTALDSKGCFRAQPQENVAHPCPRLLGPRQPYKAMARTHFLVHVSFTPAQRGLRSRPYQIFLQTRTSA